MVPNAQGCLGNLTMTLSSNKELRVRRLRSVTRNLERMQRLEEYDTVME